MEWIIFDSQADICWRAMDTRETVIKTFTQVEIVFPAEEMEILAILLEIITLAIHNSTHLHQY